ncbi:MAG: hypothetical protein HQL53_14625, partial [Magnetococcales bacterium]|nr:hypothetical protein [Magnetococcales bacterium]
MQDRTPIHLAFISGLSDKKLAQFLKPLQSLPEVGAISLYRKRPFSGDKVHWIALPWWGRLNRNILEIIRLVRLLVRGGESDVMVGCFQRFHGLWAWLAGKIHRKPVIQLVITDVDWNRERPLYNRPMMAASACGVMGQISQQKLQARMNREVRIITLPFQLPERTAEQVLEKRYDLIAVADFAIEKAYPWMLEVLS